MADEITAIVAAAGAAVLTDEQSAHLAERVTPRRRSAVTPAGRTTGLTTQSFGIMSKRAIIKAR